MPLLKKILHKLIHLHYRQEYLCFALEKFKHPLYAYVADSNNKVIRDVGDTHLFVGYKPVIIALPAGADDSAITELLLTNEPVALQAIASKKQTIASLSLEKINEFSDEGATVYFYKAAKGTYRFLNPVQKLAGYISNRLYNNKPGNVYLPGNLYQQVQIAYAVPRNICLITVGHNNSFNLFPTDLHGSYNDHYVISLRKEGKACAQVEMTKRIVISDMDASAFEKVYALGKNHMKDLRDETAFDLSGQHSENLGLPLPRYAIGYKELELLSSFDCGIHRLLIFKIIHKRQLNKTGNTLAHIHNVYATWRYRQHTDNGDVYLKR